ncbi:MAG: lipopolysaccharide biosynthesis protein [Bacteroidota bacterium]
MELAKYLKLLLKRWYILLAVPILTIACTYYLVKDMPGSYRSQAKISTGLVDETQRVLNSQASLPQESQINLEFSNLIEMMKLKKNLDQLSYSLVIHDLTSNKPYRAPSKLLQELSEPAKKHALDVYKEKFAKQEELNLLDPDQNGLYLVLRSMKYDDESLKSQFTIYRVSNSDFIYVEYSSENAELSAFAVNSLCQIFLTFYTTAVKENQFKAANFLENLMQEKYQKMNEKIDGLKGYKIDNKILNLNEQSKILYTHLMLVNSERDEAAKNIEAFNGAIGNIDSKFDPKDRRYLESSMTKINQEIISTKDQMRILSDKNILNNFQGGYKAGLDSLQKVLNSQINQLTDKYIYDPLNTKKDLIERKLTLEVQRDIARNSMNALTSQYNSLNAKFNRLVPFEAVVQSYERDIDVATREYLDVLNKYNQTSMESSFSVKLRQVQTAMPGQAESSKKIILILLAGIVSFIFCLLIFFVIYLLDKSINNSGELVLKTQIPVLGHLFLMDSAAKDQLYNIWNTPFNSSSFNDEKKLLRSIRFEADQVLEKDEKVLSITSLTPQAGKTFFSINIAIAFAMMNKDVLLIDGNFTNPDITKTLQPVQYIEDILKTGLLNFRVEGFPITIAGNRGLESSLLELGRHEDIQKLFDKLPFDIIIIETEALDAENRAKEWFLFSSKIIGVFEAGKAISGADEQRLGNVNSTGKFAGWVINKVNKKFRAN